MRNYLVLGVIMNLCVGIYYAVNNDISWEIISACVSILFMILLAMTEMKDAIKALDKTENATP